MKTQKLLFQFRQNNSGGHWLLTENIGKFTFVEADTLDEANAIAQGLGIYFGGASTGRDCSCCGSRFDRAQEPFDGEPFAFSQWDSNGDKIVVHYKDGKRKTVTLAIEKS